MIITVILSVYPCLPFKELQMLPRHLSLIFIRSWEENSFPQEVPSEREDASQTQWKGKHLPLSISAIPTCFLTPTAIEMDYNTTKC